MSESPIISTTARTALEPILSLSCIFSGLVAGVEVPRYLESLAKSSVQLPEEVFNEPLKIEEKRQKELLEKRAVPKMFQLHDELADCMVPLHCEEGEPGSGDRRSDDQGDPGERTKRIGMKPGNKFESNLCVRASIRGDARSGLSDCQGGPSQR